MTEKPLVIFNCQKASPQEESKCAYTCPNPNCHKSFPSALSLQAHIPVHDGEVPDPAGKADNKLPATSVCNGHGGEHIPKEKRERSKTCKVCGKTYTRLARLRIHERTHNGERPYICPYEGCKKSFTEKGSLTIHIRIHTGERPYTCKDCQKSFKTPGHLKEHTRRHKNDRPYLCEVCGKRFFRSSTLKAHRRRHESAQVIDNFGKVKQEPPQCAKQLLADPALPAKSDGKAGPFAQAFEETKKTPTLFASPPGVIRGPMVNGPGPFSLPPVSLSSFGPAHAHRLYNGPGVFPPLPTSQHLTNTATAPLAPPNMNPGLLQLDPRMAGSVTGVPMQYMPTIPSYIYVTNFFPPVEHLSPLNFGATVVYPDPRTGLIHPRRDLNN